MTNEVFKIKVDRAKGAVQILEQPTDVPHGFIGYYRNMRICRFAYPEYDDDTNTLFLRGSSESFNLSLIHCGEHFENIINAFNSFCVDRLYKLVIVSDKDVLGSMK